LQAAGLFVFVWRSTPAAYVAAVLLVVATVLNILAGRPRKRLRFGGGAGRHHG